MCIAGAEHMGRTRDTANLVNDVTCISVPSGSGSFMFGREKRDKQNRPLLGLGMDIIFPGKKNIPKFWK